MTESSLAQAKAEREAAIDGGKVAQERKPRRKRVQTMPRLRLARPE